MSYGYYDKYSYSFNPCNECRTRDCSFCRLTKLDEKLRDTESKVDSLEFQIRTELEPRIQSERRSYDLTIARASNA